MKVEKRSPDWNVFDDWDLVLTANKVSRDWNAVDDIVSAFSGVAQNLYAQLKELLDEWDRLLVEFGGDPTHQDWRRFRPLRLSREEDWSDWLAYLIESSESGALSCMLFSDTVSNKSNYARPQTEREVSHKEFRADVIVQWINETFTHIEVKVGDGNLLKTFPTSRVLRERYHQPQGRWSNYILLLSQQISEWEAVDHDVPGEPPVKAVTWDNVCIALRRGLQSDEKMQWKAFAYSMVGAIEQLLVGYSGYKRNNRPVENMETKIRILREGLVHG